MPVDINSVKSGFTADTGLEWSANIHAFIQYYQAKVLEQMMDQQQQQMTLLIKKVDDINPNL